MESQSSTTSLTLLDRAKSNDDQAWERIVELYGPLLYRLCRLSGLQADDAHDVTQDAFRSAFDHIDRFRHDRPGDSFRGWLLTISRNKIRDHMRRRERNAQAVGGSDMQRMIQQLPTIDWDDSSDGGKFDSSSNLVHRAIKAVRNDFENRTWQAFWKTTIEGQSAVEVAGQLEISKWSVYQAKSRVLRRMREDLQGLLD